MYIDSSALVKRYLRESGSDRAQAIVADADVIATSKLAYPELLSAFMRKHREGEIKKRTLRTILEMLDRDWESILVIEFHDELLPIIRPLITQHALKGADSIHLASAIWLARASKVSVTFVASDMNLLEAARLEDLPVINPQENE